MNNQKFYIFMYKLHVYVGLSTSNRRLTCTLQRSIIQVKRFSLYLIHVYHSCGRKQNVSLIY